MSLVKIKKRNRPFADLVTSDFFDMEDFFDNRLWKRSMFTDRFWNGRTGEPALNIKETNDSYEVELAAPGFEKKDFDVSIDNGYLHISAQKTERGKDEEENYTRREFSYNAFERSLLLPDNVLDEEIRAVYLDGILTFKISKKEVVEKPEPKKVEIS